MNNGAVCGAVRKRTRKRTKSSLRALKVDRRRNRTRRHLLVRKVASRQIIAAVIYCSVRASTVAVVEEAAHNVRIVRQRRIIPRHIAADKDIAASQAIAALNEIPANHHVINTDAVARMFACNGKTSAIYRREIATDRHLTLRFGVGPSEIIENKYVVSNGRPEIERTGLRSES